MFKLVGVLLIILAVSGLVTFIWAFFDYAPTARSESDLLDRKRKLIVRSLCTFWSCTVGFVFLMFRVASPLEVAFVVSMVLCMGYAVALINPKFLTRR